MTVRVTEGGEVWWCQGDVSLLGAWESQSLSSICFHCDGNNLSLKVKIWGKPINVPIHCWQGEGIKKKTANFDKAMVFPVVMYGCESWTIKKAECRRIDAFELWCWRRLLRVPWTATRSNQSILKEISPEWSLEGLMLKLKLQYFGHEYFDVKSWLIWKDPDAGKDWGQEEKGTTEDEMVGWHHWIT